MPNIRRITNKSGDSYQITVSDGYDIHGIQKRYYTTWTPAPNMTPKQVEKELQRQAIMFEEDCRNGVISDRNIKFEQFAIQWFEEYAKPKLKTRTIDSYEKLAVTVYHAIGHLRMNEITTRTVQKFMLNLGEEGINQRTGGKLSPKTIRNYLCFTSTVFDYAVTQGIVKANPCRGVRLSSGPTTEKTCYTLEETQRFLELLEDEPVHWRSFFTLAIYGGFRRGELCGLEWKDIDFDNQTITINRTSLYTAKTGIYTDTPKTASSRRCLKMPAEVMEVLRQHKKAQTAERLRLGDKWQYCDRLFVGVFGQPMNPQSAQTWLHDFCKRKDMRQMGIHSFRHLNASLLINSGTDIRTVSSALGHAQTSTTLNIYSHTFAVAQARASEAVASALNLKKQAISGK